jgi:hypothetical protein
MRQMARLKIFTLFSIKLNFQLFLSTVLRSPLPIVKASALDELLVMNFITE